MAKRSKYEADVQYVPQDALQDWQRQMRLAQLWDLPEVRKAWKQYRKDIGPKSMHMPREMWIDLNYGPKSDMATRAQRPGRFAARHEEVR